MRIGFRKKVGGMYVSQSISTKGLGKGILWFFALPFIMAYYVCIWPFVKLYQVIAKKNKVDRAAFNRHLAIFDDSIKLISTTTNPETFFGRYHDAERTASIMARLTTKPWVHGDPPQEAVEMLQRDKTKSTNAFLDRMAADIKKKAFSLTRGRKQKLESFKLLTSAYESDMPAPSIAYRDHLYGEMVDALENIKL